VSAGPKNQVWAWRPDGHVARMGEGSCRASEDTLHAAPITRLARRSETTVRLSPRVHGGARRLKRHPSREYRANNPGCATETESTRLKSFVKHVDSLPVGRYKITVNMSENKTDVPYGTLDLLILKTLDTMGPMHGYRIARRIEQVAENLLRLNQGSIYPALMRLEQQGWIRTQWGVSETRRRVKFYSLTKAGSKQLEIEVANWERTAALVARFLEAES
jgi:PadR family transcriptional regulator PadR